MRQSRPEAMLALHIHAEGLPVPEREARFHPERRWRSDFLWRDRRLICEVEGGLFVRGRHTRAAGFEQDARKYNEAALQGWVVLRVSPAMVRSGEAVQLLRRALT